MSSSHPDSLPKLGEAAPHGPVILDTNVFINALTATLARTNGFTIITEDRDFVWLARLAQGLNVLFYDRVS